MTTSRNARGPSPRPPRAPIRIGISGWRYAGWRGSFYPDSLPQRAEMAYACSRFPTIEVNGTFYSLQRTTSFLAWRDTAASDFVFALKGSRFITHMLQLNRPRQALANFFAQGLLCLGPKLGPILWQFSDRFRFRPDRLREFLRLLPRTHADAARLARDHDHRARDPTIHPARDCARRPIRHAIEVRNESFLTPDFLDLLREHHAAAVVSDNPGLYPVIDEPTSDFMYLRLHGAEAMYLGSYPDPAIDAWARRITRWNRLGPVFVYFDNDQKACAPFDARRLMERLHLQADFPRPGSEEAMPA